MATDANETGRTAAGPRHAVVTGASSGIGRAVAARLLRDGWSVTGMSRTRPAEHHEDTPARTWIQVDLSDRDEVADASAAVGAVDAVVHAAGVQRSAALGRLSAQDGALMWRVHVEAATVLVNALADAIRPGGRVVLIGSRTMAGAAGKSQYAATKAALVGLARSWAMELATRGITVNVVAPGPTDTPMLRDPGRAATPPRVNGHKKLLVDGHRHAVPRTGVLPVHGHLVHGPADIGEAVLADRGRNSRGLTIAWEWLA